MQSGFGHEITRKQSTESTDSVLRTSSSEGEGQTVVARPILRNAGHEGVRGRGSAEIMRITTSRTSSGEQDEDNSKINHSGFFGYDTMMGESPPSTPGQNLAPPPRRRVLPSSRASMDAVFQVETPSFGATPADFGSPSVVGAHRSPRSPRRSSKSPNKSPSKMAWSSSLAISSVEALTFSAQGGMSDRIQPPARPHPANRPVEATRLAPTCPSQTDGMHSTMPASNRPALAARLADNANSSFTGSTSHTGNTRHSEDTWRVHTSIDAPLRQPTSQDEHLPGRRLGHRDPAVSLAAQSGQYGLAAGVLESIESSAFEKLKSVRTLGQLHATGMFEARQPLLRAVDCESKMVRVAAVHELLAAPAASHAIGMDQRIELGRVLTRILDERDDSSGLGVSCSESYVPSTRASQPKS